MKRLFIYSLLLFVLGCGSRKKSVEKHAEKTETIEEKKSAVSEKTEQKTFVLENENAQQVVQIRADSVSYNPHSGDFSARGNVAIISTKKQTATTQKQDFLTNEIQSKKNDFSKVEQTQKNTSKQVEQRKTPFVFQLFLGLLLLVAGYIVYRKVKHKLF